MHTCSPVELAQKTGEKKIGTKLILVSKKLQFFDVEHIQNPLWGDVTVFYKKLSDYKSS